MSSSPLAVLFCGCRDWTDGPIIYWALFELSNHVRAKYQTTPIVIAGDAGGADAFAHTAADQLQLPHTIYTTNWDRHGRAAGPIRNQYMIDQGKPVTALAFWDGRSKGTLDMIKRLTIAGIPVAIVPRGINPNAQV